MDISLQIKQFRGRDALPYLHDLAMLRIEIFRDYPYLYDGNLAYEEEYLQTYVDCPDSLVMLVFAGETIVGASTALPLEFESPAFQKPFLEQGIPLRDVFYLGESLLKKEYRGQKIYRQFFEEREKAARAYGSRITAFCAVDRDPNDARKPADYLPLDSVWQHFGYHKDNDLKLYLEWKEVTESKISPKTLTFWLKNL